VHDERLPPGLRADPTLSALTARHSDPGRTPACIS
jgi:hypothetical protein